MEPFNNRRDPGQQSSAGIHALIPGIILVGIGALFLLDNLHIVHAGNFFEYWPVILIAIGLVQLVDADHTGRRIAGAVLMAVGGIFLADNLGLLSFRIEDLWPLILIGAGLMMLWNRTGWGGKSWWGGNYMGFGMGRFRTQAFSGAALHEFALFGGSKRIVTAQDFRGGNVSCVFGGINVDLTGAGMASNIAEMYVSALYGGVVLRIPTTWSAEVRGVGIFGGFSDNTIHPPVTPDMKRLIVKGGAVFGGVTIKN
jgi:Domain of unknown function (DUF5668)